MLKYVSVDIRHRKTTNAAPKIYEVTIKITPTKAHQIRWGRKTGAWISINTPTVNGVELGAQDWRDVLLLQYYIETTNLPIICDKYRSKLSIVHALD